MVYDGVFFLSLAPLALMAVGSVLHYLSERKKRDEGAGHK